jgi:hypothetical protein
MRFDKLIYDISGVSLDEARFDAPVNQVVKSVMPDIAKWMQTSKDGDWTSFDAHVVLRGQPVDVYIGLQAFHGDEPIESEGYSSPGKLP